MIPYFADPQVGIVQTAQYFDTDRKRTSNWLARHAGTVQDMFFTWVQPARHAIGSAFCVGTNVGYRRTALERSGGFPRVAGGEDIVTSWSLMSGGYSTLYLPLNLAKGLCRTISRPRSTSSTGGASRLWTCSFPQTAPTWYVGASTDAG